MKVHEATFYLPVLVQYQVTFYLFVLTAAQLLFDLCWKGVTVANNLEADPADPS